MTDVVANLSDQAAMSFATDFTAPDFVHFFVNGTDITLVAIGTVSNQNVPSRCIVTSVRRGRGYNVAMEIKKVEKEDAGTYMASADNDAKDSPKHYIEFNVIGIGLRFRTVNN